MSEKVLAGVPDVGAEPAAASRRTGQDAPTIWGLTPVQLHDHFWASRGVCVVRPVDAHRPIALDPELYLLTDARTLAIFRLRELIDTICWVKPQVLFVRIHGPQQGGYRETVVTDESGRFLGFRRNYGADKPRLARVALTRDRAIAQFWQSCGECRQFWRQLRDLLRQRNSRRETLSIVGRTFDRDDPRELEQFVHELIQSWPQPNATLPRVRRVGPGVWAFEDVKLDPSVRIVGPAWLGAGRSLPPESSVLGPAALWDLPECRPAAAEPVWSELDPSAGVPGLPAALVSSLTQATLQSQTAALARAISRHHRRFSFYAISKRLFDIVFSLAMIVLSLPVYAAVLLAIWLEDGRPFFFLHRRETVGGREFACIKFRSMRKDAEQARQALAEQNHADGPQFWLPHDPRTTRVGQFIRRWNIDELPQFINVLLGQMSVVGPRPSPRRENQFCPPWREARLSVRPGITGLWQVKRTRQEGCDFQEWIRYDLEYVQRAGWGLDLYILFKTIQVVLWR
ncbi:sugar transferase [Fontivita pretiosa]|uniref:sugar transferase n=1 Tax=Fontivita pretiosa TaxID=2989684 RepID=UPI003D177532